MYCLNQTTFKRDGVRYTFSCGKCLACCAKKQREWIFRIGEELKANNGSASFVTLTYEDSNLKLHKGVPVLEKPELQKFLKRLRRYCEPNLIRYFAIGEYGDIFQRPHYHLIIFNLDVNEENYQLLKKAWNKGFVSISNVNPNRISYVTKYMFKFLREPNEDFPEFRLSSKNPGIGLQYVQDPAVQHWHLTGLRTKIVQPGGYQIPLPRYFKEKLFSKPYRELANKRAMDEYFDRNAYELQEILRSEDTEKINEYMLRDQEEYARQQHIIEKFKYKQQLKKEKYHEYIQFKQSEKVKD